MSESPPFPQSFLPLHPLELRVLLVLTEGEAHGYSIVKQIEDRERHLPKIYPANLYRRIRDKGQSGTAARAGNATPEGVDGRPADDRDRPTNDGAAPRGEEGRTAR